MIGRLLAWFLAGAAIGVGSVFLMYACACSWFDAYSWAWWW